MIKIIAIGKLILRVKNSSTDSGLVQYFYTNNYEETIACGCSFYDGYYPKWWKE